ncbi:MAG: glycoside hydrolase family 57 protein [Bacteroidota bacterium]
MTSPSNNTRNLVLYFQVHQPKRLATVSFFDIGSGTDYFDEELNRSIMQRVSRNCYIPVNKLLLKLIRKHPEIKITFSISGVALEQMALYAPEALESFRDLVLTGSVELLGETYYHSLSFMLSQHEMEIQILKHVAAIDEYFGVRPSVFRNTELIYNNNIGRRVGMLGFNGVLIDGVNSILDQRNANDLYYHPEETHVRLFLRNYLLSDDIAFRFSQYGTPLTAEKYLTWLKELPPEEQLVTLAMDYETFGEHQKKETGIIDFLGRLLKELNKEKTIQMATPTEVIRRMKPCGALSVTESISWADQERDLSAWLGNEMQRDAFGSLARIEPELKNIHDKTLLHLWRCLQTSDHLYYMSTKKGSDGGLHNYFSPYPSPYEAFINYMNIMTDFSLRVQATKIATRRNKRPSVGSHKADIPFGLQLS